MAQNTFLTIIGIGLLCYLLLACIPANVSGKVTPSIKSIVNYQHTDSVYEEPVVIPLPKKRDLVATTYMLEVGVRESTGKNDGRDVEKYLASVGLGKGYAWCAAFVRWCLDQANVNSSITAWSPTAHNKSDIVYYKQKWRRNAQSGDVFTLYYERLGRIGHTGFVNRTYNDDSMVETVEGNTNVQGSREGDGVYLKFRPIKTIYSITNWINE